jgi:hypothetical protein
MKITERRRLVLVAGAMAALGLGAGRPARGGPGDSWMWKQALPAGSTVEIRNVNGGIDAAPASGAEVEVVAVKKVNEGSPGDLKIEVVKHAAGVTICAVYPANDGDPPNECKPGGGRMKIRKNYEGTVAFTVKLPASLRLQARTVNGGIKTAALGGPADVATVNGSIAVDSAAEVRAKTVNGSVTAKMDRTEWKGELELTTVNGSVKVELPASASTEVKGATVNGSIESDFGLPVEGKWGPKKVSGTIGAGGRLLNMNSVNGSLQLRKRS